MKPTDPSDSEVELSDFCYAQYLASTLSLIKDGVCCDTLTPIEVYNHMVKRAKKYSQCMTNLTAIHVIQAIQLLRKGERCGPVGGIELAITAQKILLRLFAVTNAYK